MIEEFRLISDTEEFSSYVGYRVSNMGRVQSCLQAKGHGRGKPFSPQFSNNWHDLEGYRNRRYKTVCIRAKNLSRTIKVSILVLSAFKGSRGTGIVARHLDGDPTNDRLDNLAWGTQTENKADELDCGTRMRGEKHHNSKLTIDQARDIYRRAMSGEDQHKLAAEFGILNSNISMIKKKKAWEHIHADGWGADIVEVKYRAPITEETRQRMIASRLRFIAKNGSTR